MHAMNAMNFVKEINNNSPFPCVVVMGYSGNATAEIIRQCLDDGEQAENDNGTEFHDLENDFDNISIKEIKGSSRNRETVFFVVQRFRYGRGDNDSDKDKAIVKKLGMLMGDTRIGFSKAVCLQDYSAPPHANEDRILDREVPLKFKLVGEEFGATALLVLKGGDRIENLQGELEDARNDAERRAGLRRLLHRNPAPYDSRAIKIFSKWFACSRRQRLRVCQAPQMQGPDPREVFDDFLRTNAHQLQFHKELIGQNPEKTELWKKLL